MFKKDNLHHAYFIAGERRAVLADIERFLEESFSIVRHGHPDVHYAEHESLGIDESRALQDMQLMRPIKGDRKIFILWVGAMTSEAQNSLLKVFEEPTPGTHFFVVASTERVLLPTLRSRMAVLVHPSAEKLDMRAEARKFIPMSPKARLDFVSPMIEEKDKGKAEEFLLAVASELRTAGKMGAVKEIVSLSKYLKDRSPSLKLILERVALLKF